MFKEFRRDGSKDVDHDNYLSDLRRQSTVHVFFNKASILHPNLFRMTHESLKRHGFDRPPHPPLNSRYSRKVAWIICRGDEFKTELALITQHHSKNLGAPCSAAASTQKTAPSSFCITSPVSRSYNLSFNRISALPTATVQAQACKTLNTSKLPISSQDLFQNNALNQ